MPLIRLFPNAVSCKLPDWRQYMSLSELAVNRLRAVWVVFQ
jgi:hypothetical protein